jgi:RNA polymerase sigma-70 factor (ECF subfamily)
VEGDARAREELFRRHAPLIYRLAHRLVRNPTEAEDVLQEAFVEVLASIHGYRGEAPLRSWLCRIAVRRALHHRSRRARTVQLEVLSGGAEPVQDAVAALDARAILRRINELLDRLAEDKRAIFILHEVEGYSLPEAAALLGISLTAAKKRVWRARRDLERLARGDPALETYFESGGSRDV